MSKVQERQDIAMQTKLILGVARRYIGNLRGSQQPQIPLYTQSVEHLLLWV